MGKGRYLQRRCVGSKIEVDCLVESDMYVRKMVSPNACIACDVASKVGGSTGHEEAGGFGFGATKVEIPEPVKMR